MCLHVLVDAHASACVCKHQGLSMHLHTTASICSVSLHLLLVSRRRAWLCIFGFYWELNIHDFLFCNQSWVCSCMCLNISRAGRVCVGMHPELWLSFTICVCLPVLRTDCVTLCACLYQRLRVCLHVSSRTRRLSVHQHVFARIRSLTCICTAIMFTCWGLSVALHWPVP